MHRLYDIRSLVILFISPIWYLPPLCLTAPLLNYLQHFSVASSVEVLRLWVIIHLIHSLFKSMTETSCSHIHRNNNTTGTGSLQFPDKYSQLPAPLFGQIETLIWRIYLCLGPLASLPTLRSAITLAYTEPIHNDYTRLTTPTPPGRSRHPLFTPPVPPPPTTTSKNNLNF